MFWEKKENKTKSPSEYSSISKTLLRGLTGCVDVCVDVGGGRGLETTTKQKIRTFISLSGVGNTTHLTQMKRKGQTRKQ